MKRAVWLIVLGLAVAACGNDSTTTTTTTKAGTTSSAAGSTTTATTAGAASTINIEASEPAQGQYAYKVDTTLKGGLVEIDLKNTGKEPHQAQLIKLEQGKTVQDFLAILPSLAQNGPLPDAFKAGGGVSVIGRSGAADDSPDSAAAFDEDRRLLP